jgi:hypothetical protein
MYGCKQCPAGQDICPRCSARLCMDHGTLPGDACVECELAYHEERGQLMLGWWFVAGLAVPWVLFLGILEHLPSWSARSGGVRAITTGVPMLDVIIMFSILSIFAGKAAIGLRSAFHRGQFMRLAPTSAKPSR